MNNLLCNESTDDNLYYMYMYIIKKNLHIIIKKKYLHIIFMLTKSHEYINFLTKVLRQLYENLTLMVSS